MAAHKLEQAKALVLQFAGYEFTNDDVLYEAIDTTGLRIAQSNQRLALLGDVILKHFILDDWYPTGQAKGIGNDLVATIGSNANLATAGARVGLEECIVTHPGNPGSVSDGMLSTAVEAVLGAIYVDSRKDMAVVRTAMEGLGLKFGG
ncbi:ribonuclease III [Teratosphaeria nubilosa]|uniref:Ribonuclease III n=1 Tax=Teratosphaeria nubilosa TaxID=161662 RepID=A0A6G1LCA0_9PEZI|nr:ribonuclease III [Teratosphaeria nubilosa]